jgi:hypothetical protein
MLSNPNGEYGSMAAALTVNKEQSAKVPGKIDITRIAPGDQSVSMDFIYENGANAEDIEFKAVIKRKEDEKEAASLSMDGGAKSFTIDDLRNGTDYMAELSAYDKGNGNKIAAAPVRLFRTGFVPGVVVNYIHPEDYTYNSSGRSPASPSLLRLPDGRLLASHDIFWQGGGQNLTKVFISEDEGKAWSHLSDVYPCFWGKLFIHNDKLYMMGMSHEYGDLLIFCSCDLGRTWSRPAVILKGGDSRTGGPHKAPVPVIYHNGRLWTAVEYGSWSIGGHDAGVFSVSLDADLMNTGTAPSTLSLFRAAVAEFNKAKVKGIIIDIRNNVGGLDSMVAEMLASFYTEKTLYEYQNGYNTVTALLEIQPPDGQGDENDTGLYINPHVPFYHGTVIALINSKCISSGEGLAMGIKNLPHGQTVGFYGTNGSFGMAGDEAKLPGNLEIHWPYGQSLNKNKQVQLDSRDGLGGVSPSIRTPMTKENALRIAQGEDVELEHAIAIINTR